MCVTSGVTCKPKQVRGQKSTQPEEEMNKCAGTDWQYKNTALYECELFSFFNPYPANVENMVSS